MNKIVRLLICGILLTLGWLAFQNGFAAPTLETEAAAPAPGWVVARVSYHSRLELKALSDLDIWESHPSEGSISDGYIVAMLSPQQATRLQNDGYHLEIDAARTAQVNAPRANPFAPAGIPGYSCYRTVEETLAALQQLADDYPSLAQLRDIGDSWEKATPGGAPGYDLMLLKLTNAALPGPKPAFYLMAEIHAREYATAELALRFTERLLQSYGADPDTTWLLDHFEVHILPLANPDGRKFAESGYLWRKNTDNDDGCNDQFIWGVDLNRNHSFQWGGAGSGGYACDETYRGPSPASEPEIQAIQTYLTELFSDQRGDSLNDPAPANTQGIFITLHSYGQQILWPWGFSDAQAPNFVEQQTLGRKLAYFNHYDAQQASLGLYYSSGTSDDWAYGELGVASYTFEIGTDFFQDCASFGQTILPDNLDTLMYAFKAARRPYQNPSGPDVVNLTLSSASAAAGETLTLTATANDTRFLGGGIAQRVGAARYSWDTPSWEITPTLGISATDGMFDSSIESIFAPLNTACQPAGRHTLFVEAQDSDGNWGTPTAAFITVTEITLPALTPTDQAAQEGYAGQVITYTLTAANLGNISGTFTLTVSSPWVATNLPITVTLAACESVPLEIGITLPPLSTPENEAVSIVQLISPQNQTAVAHLLTQRLTAVFLPFIVRRN